MEFRQYDVVRLKELPSQVHEQGDAFNLRQPVVGDIATIIEIYSKPLGYELECSDSAGITQWLIAFHPDEIELELVRDRNRPEPAIQYVKPIHEI